MKGTFITIWLSKIVFIYKLFKEVELFVDVENTSGRQALSLPSFFNAFLLDREQEGIHLHLRTIIELHVVSNAGYFLSFQLLRIMIAVDLQVVKRSLQLFQLNELFLGWGGRQFRQLRVQLGGNSMFFTAPGFLNLLYNILVQLLGDTAKFTRLKSINQKFAGFLLLVRVLEVLNRRCLLRQIHLHRLVARVRVYFHALTFHLFIIENDFRGYFFISFNNFPEILLLTIV